MHPVSSQRRRHGRAAGFTFVEMMVVVGLTAVLLGFGIPSMSNWLLANKAAAASEFYLEGFRAARQQAIGHNTTSRIVLSNNQTTGQMDWQVDICFPADGAPCTTASGNWSTPTTAAPNDPDPGLKYTSLRRTADVLPSSTVIAPSLLPVNAYAVYYTALGWVDTSVPNRVTSMQFDPLPAYAAQLPTTAIAITLAGMPIRCTVGLAATDSRGCQ
ncbi:MAG: prepilin-type N-terminal cleavage/methylation domain protein [Massilia sp.]|jgi:type IV fimbrial biogenesis protein FimT|nr:prepilin-type N-terminal cleavage/methylation domain protein [Massilia sp.]